MPGGPAGASVLFQGFLPCQIFEQPADLILPAVLPYLVPVAGQHLLVLPDGIAAQDHPLDLFVVRFVRGETRARLLQQVGDDVVGIADGEDRFVGGEVVEQLARVDAFPSLGMHDDQRVGLQRFPDGFVVIDLPDLEYVLADVFGNGQRRGVSYDEDAAVGGKRSLGDQVRRRAPNHLSGVIEL